MRLFSVGPSSEDEDPHQKKKKKKFRPQNICQMMKNDQPLALPLLAAVGQQVPVINHAGTYWVDPYFMYATFCVCGSWSRGKGKKALEIARAVAPTSYRPWVLGAQDALDIYANHPAMRWGSVLTGS